MLSLKSLVLTGVRSFPPEQIYEERIKQDKSSPIVFDGPITLITGKNGSGKTTIIEALYYIITGENTKKSNLINDPQIWGKNKTTAKLQLEFVSAENETVNVIRKPDATFDNKFSHNSGSISVGKKELKQSTTHINEIVLQYFGVRVPILKYVIFCRQEDSCWPVELPNGELISRFNEIFNTDRYEKAKENTDQIIKDITKKIEELKEKEKIIVLYKDQIDEYNRLSAEIKEEEPRVNELHKEVEQMEQVKMEKSSKKHENIGLIQKLQKEEADIEKKSGKEHPPQEECEEELSKSKEEIVLIDKKIQKYEESKEEEQKNSQNVEAFISEKEKQRQELDEKLKSCYEKKSIRDSNLNEFESTYNTRNYINKQKEVHKEISETKRELVKKKQEQANLESTYNNKKQEQEQERSKAYTYQIKLNENIKLLNKKLKTCEKYSHDYLINLINYRQSCAAKLEDFRKSKESPESIKRKMEDCQCLMKEAEKQIKQYEKQRDNLESRSELERKISDNETIKEEKLSAIREKFNIETLTLEDIPQLIEGLKEFSEDKVDEKRDAKTKTEVELNSISKEIETKEKVVNEKKKEISNIWEKIKEINIPEGSTFSKEIEKITTNLQEQQKIQAKLQKEESLYRTFYEAATGESCKCPLCMRGFANDEERDFVHNMLNDNIKEAHKNRIITTNEIKKLNNDLQKLESHKEDFQNYEKLTNEVNTITQEIEHHKLEQEQKQRELKVAIEQFEKASDEKRSLEGIINESPILENSIVNIKKYKKELQDLISQQNLQGLPSLKEVKESLEKSRLRYQKYEEESKKLPNQLSDAHKIDRELENTFNEAENECKQYEDKLNEKNQAEKDIKELSEKYKEASKKLKITEDNIKKIEEEFGPQIAMIQLEVANLSNNLQELNHKGQDIDKVVKTLLDAERFLKENNQKSLETEHESTIKEITIHKKKHEECKSKLRNIEEELKKEKNNRKEHAEIVEKMSQHVQYYENHNKLLECQHNIDELVLVLSDIEQKRIKLEEKYEHEKGELDQKKGKLAATTTFLDNHTPETKEFIGQPGILNENRIRIAALKMAKEDLITFNKAISDSLLDYHQRMIKETNRIIKQLWSKTYIDKDVSTIKINAEMKDGKYQYSVVMEKNGVEMSVRERCSAGQKMLASLTIRLALSQVFANNCGIIALDEPTTNLDNSKATEFAKQLSKLVKKRKEIGTGNIQMIIVSHSEEFCQQITDELNIDHYYEIEKKSDSENRSYSQITRREISQFKLN